MAKKCKVHDEIQAGIYSGNNLNESRKIQIFFYDYGLLGSDSVQFGRVGGTCCLHLQHRPLFSPEDGGSRFHRNCANYLRNYKASNRREVIFIFIGERKTQNSF
jgi:hypothetical protein